ncbi:nucleotide sugar dehydrogenase [Nitrospinaceae bacterium]|jgi:UDP-N-acetyl-D-mannosaminuronic acid dehydrogenase|nr:nucleotide sugar dehydrogenase [Nitrospinaceae bacterium]
MNPLIRNTFVSPDAPIYKALEVINQSPSRGGPTGIALVVEGENRLLGILTDGDIRTLLLDRIDLNDPVKKHMNKTPITVSKDLKGTAIVRALRERIASPPDPDNHRNPKSLAALGKILIADNECIEDILSPLDLLQDHNVVYRHACILGMGYVGLTLAMVLADDGFQVTGIDPNSKVLSALRQKKAPFFEQGLEPLIERHFDKGFNLLSELGDSNFDIYVVAVGTPVSNEGIPILDDLNKVLAQIAKVLKFNDLVILRSTVPPRTCRDIAIPILEKGSDLKAGKEFHFVFAPERTIQGKALEELRVLPQIIGGYTPECVNAAAQFFNVFSPTIVKVDSLEASEIVKLLNNSFRDVSFGYANQIGQFCEALNVDTVATINAANEGYLRNPLPLPSPGVGGTCLQKDPYILVAAAKSQGIDMSLVREARNSNESMIQFVGGKVENFFDEHKLAKNAKIFILGIAFKGSPETSDIRASTSIDTIQYLKSKKLDNILVYDPVASRETLGDAGLKVVESVEDGFRGSHIVLIMNNHPSYINVNLFQLISLMQKPGMFFDAWHLFQQKEVESIPGIFYQGLGTRKNC